MPTLYFDITKFRRQNRHRSGLNRVSVSLQRELKKIPGLELVPVYWSTLRRGYLKMGSKAPVGQGKPDEAFITPETFALKERPFSRKWLGQFRGVSEVIFYDAIPFLHPNTTWPRSVRRFPHWFRDLQAYDKVIYISGEAREQAMGVQEETGMKVAEGDVLCLGADYTTNRLERLSRKDQPPILLNVGIIEHRKGQSRLLEAAEDLWKKGMSFKLVFLGRVNPHFGKDIAERMKELQRQGRPLIHEIDADDTRLEYWHQRASLTVLPTRAEGYGLPAVEALWAGCPVLGTRHPSLEGIEYGVKFLEDATTTDIHDSLEAILADPQNLEQLEKAIESDTFPLWSDSAKRLVQDLGFSDIS